MKQLPQSDVQQINDGKIYAILSYLSILCVIPLAMKKENPFVLKHGKQGLVIFVAEAAVFILHIILGQWIFQLGMFVLGVLSFIGIIAVLKGEYVKLPVVADIADQITL